jgi:hypothetical protein
MMFYLFLLPFHLLRAHPIYPITLLTLHDHINASDQLCVSLSSYFSISRPFESCSFASLRINLSQRHVLFPTIVSVRALATCSIPQIYLECFLYCPVVCLDI